MISRWVYLAGLGEYWYVEKKSWATIKNKKCWKKSDKLICKEKTHFSVCCKDVTDWPSDWTEYLDVLNVLGIPYLSLPKGIL